MKVIYSCISTSLLKLENVCMSLEALITFISIFELEYQKVKGTIGEVVLSKLESVVKINTCLVL